MQLKIYKVKQKFIKQQCKQFKKISLSKTKNKKSYLFLAKHLKCKKFNAHFQFFILNNPSK